MTATNLRMWHERLGHIGKRAIRELVKKELVKGVSILDCDDFFCEACQLGKAHRKPFKKCIEKVKTEPGEEIHTDVCGPMSTDSLGARFFLTFKDDATSFRHIYFIKHKSDVFDKFKEFAQLVKNKFNRSIKILWSDNGRKFCNAKNGRVSNCTRYQEREYRAAYARAKRESGAGQQNYRGECANDTELEESADFSVG